MGSDQKHSTIHPILHLLNNCAEDNNTVPKKFTLSVFCDLSKAFDVISHKILIKKLNYYGIRGIANEWFADYLTNRVQYVDIEGTSSTFQPIQCGIPLWIYIGSIIASYICKRY